MDLGCYLACSRKSLLILYICIYHNVIFSSNFSICTKIKASAVLYTYTQSAFLCILELIEKIKVIW